MSNAFPVYYTNSFHIPVYFPISAAEKIHLEAPYHALTNAGHITYVELDGDPSENVEAVESLVRYMHDEGIGYGSINHPLDRDPVCGYTGIIEDVCPRCGRREGEAVSIKKLIELRKKYPNMPKICGCEWEVRNMSDNKKIGKGVKFERIRRITG